MKRWTNGLPDAAIPRVDSVGLMIRSLIRIFKKKKKKGVQNVKGYLPDTTISFLLCDKDNQFYCIRSNVI